MGGGAMLEAVEVEWEGSIGPRLPGPDAMRILVVDDESTSRLVTLMALRNLGHESHTARDGADAWDQFQSLRPEVVISDWVMPGLTGLELCRKHSGHATGYTYFMIVTGQRSPDQMLEGLVAGADDYLVKPLDPDDLETHLIAAERVTSLHRRLAPHQQIKLDQAGRRQTGVVGDHDQLGAVAGVELRQQPAHVGLGGGRADVELVGDLGVRQARGDQLEHLALAVGEHVEPGGVGARSARAGSANSLDQATGDARGEQRVAGGHDPDAARAAPPVACP